MWVIRLVLAVVVAAAGLFAGITGGWLAMWFVWGSAVGLIVARWWALWVAVLPFAVAFTINNIATYGELDGYHWYLGALWALVPMGVALAGIAMGIGVVRAGRSLRAKG